MSRHIPDAIAGFFGYVSTREAARQVTFAHADGMSQGLVTGAREGNAAGRAQAFRSPEFALAVAAKAGEIEAERNGYKAQWEQAEKRLKVANARLQRADKMPVTSFV